MTALSFMSAIVAKKLVALVHRREPTHSQLR